MALEQADQRVRVRRVISGRTPMRAGKMVSPRPVFTWSDWSPLV